MHIQLIDVVGAIGGLLFLFAFYRTSIGRWTGKSFWYEMDNFLGAALMTVYAYYKTAYISIILNIVLGIVAFRGVQPYAERRLNREVKKTKRNIKKVVKQQKVNKRRLQKYF